MFKENVIVAIGFLSKSFGELLSNSTSKIIQIILSNFEINRPTLQQSCARALSEIYLNSLTGKEQQTLDKIIFDKLLARMDTKNQIDQSTTCLCLYEFLLLFQKTGRRKEFIHLGQRVLIMIAVNILDLF